MRWLCLLVVLTAFVGCGSAQSTQLTRFVARASKLCPEAMAGFSGRAERSDPVAVKEVEALLRANENLPLVRSFLADVGERRRLRRTEEALRARTPPADRPNPELRKLFDRQVEIFRRELRLPGIGECTQSPYSNF
jgi:hypothetical protein